jgi:hypothetical protein
MIKDGVGMHWEQSSIWETKKHPIMSCLTQGIEKLTFLAKKQDVSAYYSYYNTTIGILSASHTGM